MSHPKNPLPAYFFASIIYQRYDRLEEAINLLSRKEWNVSKKTEEMDFHHTDYYCEEMGKPLKRIFIFFEPLSEREKIVVLKHFSYSIEKQLSQDGKRSVNIDPGYLTLENIVLSTFKNYSHRIYLGEGVFAEITLMYRERSYEPLPWTYPDYRSDEIIKIFNREREEYKRRIKK
jgi:hypothetical protein